MPSAVRLCTVIVQRRWDEWCACWRPALSSGALRSRGDAPIPRPWTHGSTLVDSRSVFAPPPGDVSVCYAPSPLRCAASSATFTITASLCCVVRDVHHHRFVVLRRPRRSPSPLRCAASSATFTITASVCRVVGGVCSCTLTDPFPYQCGPPVHWRPLVSAARCSLTTWAPLTRTRCKSPTRTCRRPCTRLGLSVLALCVWAPHSLCP
jgi:hypothetical protein